MYELYEENIVLSGYTQMKVLLEKKNQDPLLDVLIGIWTINFLDSWFKEKRN